MNNLLISSGEWSLDYTEDVNRCEDTLEDLDPINTDFVTKALVCLQQSVISTWKKHRVGLWLTRCVFVLLAVGGMVYLGFALERDHESCIFLYVLAAIIILWFVFKVIGRKILKKLSRGSCCNASQTTLGLRMQRYTRWFISIGIIVGVIIFACVDNRDRPRQLVPIAGVVVIILLLTITSVNFLKISWLHVSSGLAFQLVMALLVIKWRHGFQAFRWLGDQVTGFLGHVEAGSAFLFGENFFEHEFVFAVLPAIIFFAAITEACYYFGLLQAAIQIFGYIMSTLTCFGPIECFFSAANIFLGPNNSAMTVARWMTDMTMSELHCLMTTGFATVTGSLLGAYVSFGVPASHIITASVLSSPAALTVARLVYPETDNSKLMDVSNITFPKSPAWNVYHSFTVGGYEGMKIVIFVAGNLVAFVSLLEFLNLTLAWFGLRAGVDDPPLTIQFIGSYLFVPLAYLMGVRWADCLAVGRLLGIKLVLTDIVGYIELGQLVKNREQGLDGPTISPRSEVIATYALCGFGSFPDIAICLAAIGTICPPRKKDLSVLALRSMLAGNFACFLTACIAGLLYDDDALRQLKGNSTDVL